MKPKVNFDSIIVSVHSKTIDMDSLGIRPNRITVVVPVRWVNPSKETNHKHDTLNIIMKRLVWFLLGKPFTHDTLNIIMYKRKCFVF